MREEMKEFFDSRINSLNKDYSQLKDAIGINDGDKTYLNLSKESIEYMNDMKKVEEELKRANSEKQQIEESEKKISDSKNALEKLEKTNESLLKEKKEYEARLAEFNEKIFDKDNSEINECKQDLAKINAELETLPEKIDENKKILKENTDFVQEYMEKHNIKHKEREKEENSKDKEEKSEQKDINKEEKEENSKKEETKNSKENTTNENTTRTNTSNIYQQNNTNQPKQSNTRNMDNSYNTIFQPVNKNDKYLYIERKASSIALNGKKFKIKDINPDILNDITPDILSNPDSSAVAEFFKQTRFIERCGDKAVLNGICEMFKNEPNGTNIMNAVNDYYNLMMNPENSEKFNLKYDVKGRWNNLFGKGKQELKEAKNEAFNAREYAEVDAGLITKMKWRMQDLANKQIMIPIPDVQKIKETAKKTLTLGKNKVVGKFKDKSQKLNKIVSKARNKVVNQKDKFLDSIIVKAENLKSNQQARTDTENTKEQNNEKQER